MRKNRHSSGRSPVIHLTVRMWRIPKSRLRWPAPAKAMMTSWGTHKCHFDKGGATRFLSCCALALSKHCGHLCICHHTRLRVLLELAPRLRGVSRSELRGVKAVAQCSLCSAVQAAAPPTSPLMALLIDPLAVRAQALLPRCSSQSFLLPVLLPSLLLPSCTLLIPTTVGVVLIRHFFPVPLGTSASTKWKRYRHKMALDW